jgi:hypothetical protein
MGGLIHWKKRKKEGDDVGRLVFVIDVNPKTTFQMGFHHLMEAILNTGKIEWKLT